MTDEPKKRGGARPGAGQPLLRPDAGKLVDFSARIPEKLDEFLRSQAGGPLGRSRSDVGARLLEKAARDAGYSPRLSPDDITQLKAKRDEITRILAENGIEE
jgi:hypothetical protein